METQKHDTTTNKRLSNKVMNYIDSFVRTEGYGFQQNVPIKIIDVNLNTIDDIISSEPIGNIQKQNGVRYEDKESWIESIPEIKEMYDLASREYRRSIFGKRVKYPQIGFEHKGYEVSKANSSSFSETNKDFIFVDGMAYPKGLYLRNKTKSIEETKTALKKLNTLLLNLKGNSYDSITRGYGGKGQSLQDDMDFMCQESSWTHPLIPKVGNIFKKSYYLLQNIHLFNWHKPIGQFLSGVTLPDGTLLTKDKFIRYYHQKAEEVE